MTHQYLGASRLIFTCAPWVSNSFPGMIGESGFGSIWHTLNTGVNSNAKCKAVENQTPSDQDSSKTIVV